MEFKISGRHIEVTPAIQEYARKKTSKLLRFYDRILSIETVVERRDRMFEVEIITNVEHHPPFLAREVHEDLYAAIDVATDRLERQLHDHKEKLRNRKHIA